MVTKNKQEQITKIAEANGMTVEQLNEALNSPLNKQDKRKYNRMAKQAGMTLIELSVVLLVLVGLAGLVVPYVGSFADKTHDSTTIDTIKELNGSIQRYQGAKLALPSNLETLNTGSALYNKLKTTAFLTVSGATNTHLANAALNAAGVRSVLNNDNSTKDATFASVTGAPVTLASMTGGTDQKLTLLTGNAGESDQTFYKQLTNPAGEADAAGNLAATTESDAQLKNQLMYAFGGTADSWDTACTNYVVMGVGQDSSLIPTIMQSAPVHFSGSSGDTPATVYNRFVAVFAVPNGTFQSNAADATCLAPDAKAKFVGTGAVMGFPALVGLNGAQRWSNSNLTK